MSRPPPNAKISLENGVWVVRIERPGGKLQEYHCASEAQARGLIESFEKQPAY